MARAELTNGLLERLPTREEIEIRLTENSREKRLLQQLLKVAEQREQVEQSAADVNVCVHAREFQVARLCYNGRGGTPSYSSPFRWGQADAKPCESGPHSRHRFFQSDRINTTRTVQFR